MCSKNNDQNLSTVIWLGLLIWHLTIKCEMQSSTPVNSRTHRHECWAILGLMRASFGRQWVQWKLSHILMLHPRKPSNNPTDHIDDLRGQSFSPSSIYQIPIIQSEWIQKVRHIWCSFWTFWTVYLYWNNLWHLSDCSANYMIIEIDNKKGHVRC